MSETVKIEIDLSCDFWNYNPFDVEVSVNNQTVFHDEIEEKITISADVSINGDTENLLKLTLSGKTEHDTITDGPGGAIVKDVLLNIHDIRFDDISVGHLIWTNSFYYPNSEYNLEVPIKNCVNLGWNGIWNFPFESPIYIWLLENLD